jgi:hypothetical protein
MREIRIQGTWSNATVTITAGGIVCDNILINDCIFSFTSPSKFHGSVPISIKVIAGQVALGKVLVRYPTNVGTITFPIPMNSIGKIHSNYCVEQLSNIVINAGETFEYDHLIVNGPNYWITDMQGDIYFEDITEVNITPIFEYAPHTATHRNNIAFTELERLLISKAQ